MTPQQQFGKETARAVEILESGRLEDAVHHTLWALEFALGWNAEQTLDEHEKVVSEKDPEAIRRWIEGLAFREASP